MNKGFTLIELVVVIAIICIMSGIILFTVTQYIDRGKDSNLDGNMAILIPAGENYYAGNSNSYGGFCNPSINNIISNTILNMPAFPTPLCTTGLTPGVCCTVDTNGEAWAACAQEFTDPSKAYCVDSRGEKDDICCSACNNKSITQCPDATTQTLCSKNCQ